MFNKIQADFDRYIHIELDTHTPSSYEILRLFLSEPGLQAICIYRFGFWIKNQQHSLLRILLLPAWPAHGIFSYLISKLFGIKIESSAIIGSGFYIGHFSGIEIGNSVIIGDNCSIHQHVKIISDTETPPTRIGSHVWIGPHARILAGINITSNATIAAGTHITEDIKTASLVMGVPAQIVLNEYDNSELL